MGKRDRWEHSFVIQGESRGILGEVTQIRTVASIDEDTLEYTATLEDPRAFTRPWTLSIPLIRDDGYRMYEYACHEGNYGMPNILSAALKE